MSELFKLYSAVRQPQFGLDPDLDESAVLHFGYVIDYSKALEYAKQHDVLRDPTTGRFIDWDHPPTQWLMKAQTVCMMDIVHFFSQQHHFIFRYASVMGGATRLHAISMYTNSQNQLGLGIKAHMRLMNAIVKAFDLEDPVPMWWWDAEKCGIRYRSNVARYNPMLPPPKPKKSRARSRLAEAASAERQVLPSSG